MSVIPCEFRNARKCAETLVEGIEWYCGRSKVGVDHTAWCHSPVTSFSRSRDLRDITPGNPPPQALDALDFTAPHHWRHCRPSRAWPSRKGYWRPGTGGDAVMSRTAISLYQGFKPWCDDVLLCPWYTTTVMPLDGILQDIEIKIHK